jgi:hypothetical protein
MADKSIILRNVKETLSTANFGLLELDNTKPDRRIAGLRNFVSFSRSVTFVLQNLRSTENDFDEWYGPYVKEMSSNPLFKYFVELRNIILKTGDTKTHAPANVTHFDSSYYQSIPKPPLPIKGFFMGDNIGGSGWIVSLPDGTEEPFYIDIPPDLIQIDLKFKELPDIEDLKDKSIQQLCTVYYDYLDSMVKDAFKRFS